jgi:hypothetical protein
VASVPTEGSLHDRCHDMRLLTVEEQNAQLDVMKTYGAAWKERAEISKWCSTAAWQATCNAMDAELFDAQEKWKSTFPERWAKRRTWTEAIKDALSPRKRKRERQPAASVKKHRQEPN